MPEISSAKHVIAIEGIFTKDVSTGISTTTKRFYFQDKNRMTTLSRFNLPVDTVNDGIQSNLTL